MINQKTYLNIIHSEDRRDYLEWRKGSGQTVEIFDICVGGERRTGRGRSLVQKLLRAMSTETVTVWALTRPSNLVACSFYSAFGFKVLAVLRDFYGVGFDAVMYGLSVENMADREALLQR